MLLALDYDGTYTRDPTLWLELIRRAKERKHEVIVVTMRHEHEKSDMCEELLKLVHVVFTSRKAKARHLLDTPYRPDIWIDDNPLWIIQDV